MSELPPQEPDKSENAQDAQSREFKPEIEDRYIGDGVYASFDGYQILLDLRGQYETTRIALEPIVFEQLVRFKDDILKAAKQPKDKEP